MEYGSFICRVEHIERHAFNKEYSRSDKAFLTNRESPLQQNSLTNRDSRDFSRPLFIQNLHKDFVIISM